MRVVFAFLTAAVLLLSGCAALAPAALPGPAAVTPVEQAQASINEANLLITAAAHVIEANRKAQILTEAEYWDFGNQLLGYANDVDVVQAALRNGVPDAPRQAEMLKTLVTALHREIAAKARSKP